MSDPSTRTSDASRRPRNAFATGVARSIRGSLGRFLAIMGIVALGCGFFAGLQMSGEDMRRASDVFYDGTSLWDLRVISTLGLADEDLDRLKAIEGVEQVMPSTTCDAMARLGGEQIAVRISTIDVEAAKGAEQVSAIQINSSKDDYLNRPFLVDGRWPEGADECVIAADKLTGSFGIGDIVEVIGGGDSLDDVLESRSLKIVGTVSSSNYPYTGSFGSTTLGSGMVAQYLFVTEDALVEDAPYTEAYLLVEGARGCLSESSDYDEVVDPVKGRIEDMADELAHERQADIKAKAQEKLDEKIKEYNEELDDAYGKLEDARQELEDAYNQIEDGRRQLEDGIAAYEQGIEEYNNGVNQLNDGEQAWVNGYNEMATQLGNAGIGGASLEELRANVSSKIDEANGGIQQLSDGIAQASDGAAQARAGIAQLNDGIAQTQAGIDGLLQKQAFMGLTEEEQVTLATLQAQLPEMQAQVAYLEGEAAKADGMVQQLSAQRAEVEARLPQLNEALAGIDRLISTRAELDDAATRLNNSYPELMDAANEIASAREELDEAIVEYEDGLAEWQRSKDEADEKFADARKQLDEAQQDINDIELGDLYVLDRSQSEGAATYHADSERIDSIADVFPFMFFLVAALVALTTMTRMVEDERQEIGTYKALGYGTAQIASRYLTYAAIAGVVGATVGIAILSQVLPYIIMSAYSIIYTYPPLPLPLPIDPLIALASGGLGVGVTLAATWFAVVSSLRETPATLMLPRAPAAGKRILLERIGPLWSHVSFSWKVTLRNLFRYKRRFLMTVIGVSGCTALLLVGFGLHDSIWDIIDRQYGPIVHYDTTIGLDDDATSLDVDKVVAYLEKTGEVSDIVRVQQENMRAGGTGVSTSVVDTTHVSVVIPQNEPDLTRSLTFRDRLSGNEVPIDENAVLVTEKLASLHGIEVGGQIVLYDQDDVGNATGEGYRLTVTGVVENYVGNIVYVGRSAWRQVSDKTMPFSTLYGTVEEDAAIRAELSDALHDMRHVSTVIYSDETINMYRNMLSVVDMVVVVLIVSAGALAFIVLYNLTNINIGERVREIASLKVLGFTRGEVYAYIFREIAILALIGDVLGMVLGTFLEGFVVRTAEVDYVMFGRVIHPESYCWSFALTLVFTALILLFMRHKLDRVSMVESLKSVD